MLKNQGRADGTKRQIAQKAKIVFEKKGYSATSMEDIRKFAQVSKGSIYYHFDSKEELFLYTVEKVNEVWRNNWLEQAQMASSATEKLYLLAEYYASDMQNPLSSIVPEYMGSGKTEEIVKEKIRPLFEPEFDIYYSILEEGIENGEFITDKNVEELAFMLYGTLTGLSITQFFGYKDQKFYAIYKRAIDVFLSGISGK